MGWVTSCGEARAEKPNTKPAQLPRSHLTCSAHHPTPSIHILFTHSTQVVAVLADRAIQSILRKLQVSVGVPCDAV